MHTGAARAHRARLVHPVQRVHELAGLCTAPAETLLCERRVRSGRVVAQEVLLRRAQVLADRLRRCRALPGLEQLADASVMREIGLVELAHTRHPVEDQAHLGQQ